MSAVSACPTVAPSGPRCRDSSGTGALDGCHPAPTAPARPPCSMPSWELLKSKGHIRIPRSRDQRGDAGDRVQEGLCLVPERRELFADMAVEDNLLLGAFRRPRAERKQTLEQIFARLPRLKERDSNWPGRCRGGEQQMLAMGRALMARPRLICMDEPSLGLAPILVQTVFDIILAVWHKGRSLPGGAERARRARGGQLVGRSPPRVTA